MASDHPLAVIIVGAGIAGLAAARALREHDVLVLEQTRMKSEIGAAIHLGPNASKIGLQWGMDLEKLGSPECVAYIEFVGETGAAQIKAPINPRVLFGAPWLLNHRVDLHNELRRLATLPQGELEGKPAVIRAGARVTAIDCENGTVTLDDGAETLHADLIVAADGIHSVARTAVLGNQRIAQPSGHSAYRCLIPAADLSKDPELAFLVDNFEGKSAALTAWIAKDRRVVTYPCRRFEYLNVVGIIPDVSLGEASVESWSADGTVAELVAAFSTFTPLVQRLLSYAPSCGLWQLRDQDPLPTWVKGKVILIGDAAHAMLPHQGQGGSQSFEDAEALGALFAGFTVAPGDKDSVHERLELVQKVRKERASKIQGYSRTKALGVKVGNTWSADPNEFSAYNFNYSGAVDWAHQQGIPT